MLDGVLDRDELDAGSNPADFTSLPGGPQFMTLGTGSLQLSGSATSSPNTTALLKPSAKCVPCSTMRLRSR